MVEGGSTDRLDAIPKFCLNVTCSGFSLFYKLFELWSHSCVSVCSCHDFEAFHVERGLKFEMLT